MKHVFLVNPVAGKSNPGAWLPEKIRQAARRTGVEAKILLTQYRGHGREIARRYAESGEPAILYACGGDGTLNEVLQSAVGCETLTVGCVPCGSGNDYVRNFGGAKRFLDLEAQLTGTRARIDAIETNFGYSAAICAAGLDAKVAYGIPKYRRLPLCGGSMAYRLSILEVLLGKLGCEVRVIIDGRQQQCSCMLLALCNGQQYGGGYKAAPLGAMDDGLLDVVLIKPIPRIKLAGALALYKKGAHLLPDGTVAPALREYMQYCRARSVELQVLGSEPIILTLDGECTPCRELQARVCPDCLNILLPRGAAADSAALTHCGAAQSPL